MSKKTERELELEAELKGLLSGEMSAADFQAIRSHDTEPRRRHTGTAPQLAAPYGGPAAMDLETAAQNAVIREPNHDSRDPYAAIVEAVYERLANRFERLETRTVRLETRVTNTMRYLGFPPRAPLTGRQAPNGEAIWSDGRIVVTGPNVPVRDILWLAARHDPQGDVPIIINNVLWATLHVNPTAPHGHEQRVD